jgi:hypothetical protein
MSRRRAVLALLSVTALVVAMPGCQRVNIEKTVTLEFGDIKQAAIIDAPSGEQKIRVQIDATEPIDVDVALVSNFPEIEKALTSHKRPDAGKVLASKQDFKSDSVDATIPAGKSYTVILSGAKKTSQVKLKVNSI